MAGLWSALPLKTNEFKASRLFGLVIPAKQVSGSVKRVAPICHNFPDNLANLNSSSQSPSMETQPMLQLIETETHPLSDIDACVARAWLDLVAFEAVESEGDDWLHLCGDIDEGEFYREWFLWQDVDVTNDWEAYDPVTNERFVAEDLESLKRMIDRIEDSRKPVPDYLRKVAV